MTVKNQPPELLTQLILSARSGDRDAQGRLLEVFEAQLRVHACGSMSAKLGSRIDASDVIQQTYVAALRSFEQFRGATPQEFSAWLRTVQGHVLLNLIRQHVNTQRRSVHNETAWTNAIANANPTDASTPSGKLMNREAVMQLTSALGTLPTDQREAVRLRFCETMSLGEIAANMQRSKEAVAGLLRRGLTRLRRTMAESATPEGNRFNNR